MAASSAIIQSFITPVVLISACGLLHLAFANRLAVIVGRLRAFDKEKSELAAEVSELDTKRQNYFVWRKNRLETISAQRTLIVKRAKLMRRAILFLQGTLMLLILTSLALGIASEVAIACALSVGLFVASLILLLGSILFSFCEMLFALESIDGLDPVETPVDPEMGA